MGPGDANDKCELVVDGVLADLDAGLLECVEHHLVAAGVLQQQVLAQVAHAGARDKLTKLLQAIMRRHRSWSGDEIM